MPVDDANDTKGRADLKRVRVIDDRPRKWVIKTWSGWQINDFFERGWFVVYLDTYGNGRFDYYVFVRAKRSALGAAILRDRKGDQNDRLVSNVKVKKIGPALIKVRVPFADLSVGKNRLDFRWYARSIWSSHECRRLCFDRAPNRGAVSELFVPNP